MISNPDSVGICGFLCWKGAPLPEFVYARQERAFFFVFIGYAAPLAGSEMEACGLWMFASRGSPPSWIARLLFDFIPPGLIFRPRLSHLLPFRWPLRRGGRHCSMWKNGFTPLLGTHIFCLPGSFLFPRPQHCVSNFLNLGLRTSLADFPRPKSGRALKN